MSKRSSSTVRNGYRLDTGKLASRMMSMMADTEHRILMAGYDLGKRCRSLSRLVLRPFEYDGEFQHDVPDSWLMVL